MAHLVGIVGDTSEGREKYLASLKSSLMCFEGLSFGRATSGNASLAWALSPSAPLNTASENGSYKLVLGTADNYYLSFVLDRDGSVILSTDTLGLFPLYYYSTPQILIFSTTPGVFRHYPGFSSELSAEGLAGLLITGMVVQGQTLLKGVRRLSSGHVLSWKPGLAARELPGQLLIPSDIYFGEGFDKNVERLDGVLSEAVNRNSKGSSLILLSGGLDTRLLAGYLHEAEGKNVIALTQGLEDDIEMKCATQVARCLDWQHEKVRPSLDSFETDALLRLDLEHLVSGFNMTLFSQLVPRLRAISRPVYTAAHGDAVIGGSTIRPADTRDFENYFRRVDKDAFAPETARKLIRPDILRDGLDHAKETLQKIYHSYEGIPFQRVWLCNIIISNRVRVIFPWYLAFGSWPVLPFADRKVLETMAGMPPTSIANRRMETELICRRFRPLSFLPLDRNSYDNSPVFGLKRLLRQRTLGGLETLKILQRHTIAKVGGPILRGFDKQLGKDRRYYYRILDIRHAGWQRLRQRAETARPRMESICDPKMLRRFWPDPKTALTLKDGIADAHKIKLLIGLALWMERNLP